MIHVTSISPDSDDYLSYRTQITSLKTDEAPISIPSEYADFTNILSKDLIAELPEYIEINDYTVELINGYQPLYEPIYSLGPVELKILKIYIKTNLTNCFIRPLKSL